ncbi:hypothetical protein JW935_22675 [candidate division KSB1 bacterium]|nr:hypothetical protein [candidate division KSB1 bacterium]
MKCNKGLIVLVGLLLLWNTTLTAQTNIAVMEMTAKGLSDTEASILTDRLRLELFKLGDFKVIEREMMDQILQEQGFQQTGCTSDECIVQIGQLIGVEQMVGGSVSKFGNMYSIAARIVSVESGEILRIATYDHEGQLEGLLKYGISSVAAQLTGRQTAPAPVPPQVRIADNRTPAIMQDRRKELQPGAVYLGVEVLGKGIMGGVGMDFAVGRRTYMGTTFGIFPDEGLFSTSITATFLAGAKARFYIEPGMMLIFEDGEYDGMMYGMGLGYHYLSKNNGFRFKIGPMIVITEDEGVWPWGGMSFAFRL